MADALILWSHALAALGFCVLGVWALKRAPDGLPRHALAIALGLTGLWALSIAGIGGADPGTRLAEAVRTLALLTLMMLLRRRASEGTPVGLATVYGVVALVVMARLALQLARPAPAIAQDVAATAALFWMLTSVAALVLAHDIHRVLASRATRLIVAGLGIVWLADLNAATALFLTAAIPDELMVARGCMLIGAAALIAVGLGRRDGAVSVSRTIAFQSLSLVAIGGAFAILTLATSTIGALGGERARALQTAFVLGSTVALLTLASSSWLRAWAKVKIAKHLFAHRYDYRAEWMRFSGTLGAPDDAASLDVRVVKAVADLTTSPAGLLLVADGDGLGIAAGWNWPADDLPTRTGEPGFVRHLASGRIVELDSLRHDHGDAGDVAATPQWLIDRTDAWAVVPLLHLERLAGAIVLARPPLDRALDWEDLDLLRIAGRQVASHLAEARARDALAQAERFDEFNRRFAFIVHDIKNLVSGLSLLARNAERHADNPAFRADMVATLQDSSTKLAGLLARLSQHARAPHDATAPVDVAAVAERVAAARRGAHPVLVRADAGAVALADAAALEQLLGHLVQNAIEASAPADPVTIAVEACADAVRIAVVDRGCGMSPAFVRDQLFRPFASTKPNGFGIGAYEARQLAESFGGRIEVESREGAGSTFRVVLRPAFALERAA